MQDIKGFIKEKIVELDEADYRHKLAEQRIDFDTWIREREVGLARYDMRVAQDGSSENAGRNSATTQKTMEYSARLEGMSFRIIPYSKLAPGFTVKTYIDDVLIFVNGELTDRALPLIMETLKKYPDCSIIYGDEDIATIDTQPGERYGKTIPGTRRNPFFKPTWSPNRFLSHFYFGNIVAMRRATFREMIWTGESKGAEFLYHNLIRFIWSNEFMMRKSVRHISEILIHTDDYENVKITDDKAIYLATGKREESARNISVVIPSKDNPEMLRECLSALLGSILEGTVLDIVVVDNGSSEENRRKIVDMQVEFPFRYEYGKYEFNFSYMCNLGAADAVGDVVLWLNDDIVGIEEGAIERMYRECMLKFTGAVGAKLLYPESKEGRRFIQHVGITNINPGPVHKLQGKDDAQVLDFGRNRYAINVCAVTGAALMVRRSVLDELGGFDENLKVAYNDVDLCLRLFEAGLYNCSCNDVYMIHKESATRGYDANPEKIKRLKSERRLLYEKHPIMRTRDRFFGKYLDIDSLTADIRTANEYNFEDAAEHPAKSSMPDTDSIREDMCVCVTVEYAGKLSDFRAECDSDSWYVQGHCEVLGSNNACFSKALVLISTTHRAMYPIVGSYRADVCEALPDQVNIGLSGFSVVIPGNDLPAGTYRVGVMVSRHHSKEKIMYVSNTELLVHGNE